MSDMPEYLKCTRLQLHNFADLEQDTHCSWCGLTVKEIERMHMHPWLI